MCNIFAKITLELPKENKDPIRERERKLNKPKTKASGNGLLLVMGPFSLQAQISPSFQMKFQFCCHETKMMVLIVIWLKQTGKGTVFQPTFY